MKKLNYKRIFRELMGILNSRRNLASRYLGIFSGMFVLVLIIIVEYNYTTTKIKLQQEAKLIDQESAYELDEYLDYQREPTEGERKKYLVLWYNVLLFLRKRPRAMIKDFSKCKYNNCLLTFDKSLFAASNAVLFDGRNLEKVKLRKREGQIWIFAAHEAPVLVEESREFLKMPRWKGKFNWTMTYDHWRTDIHLPYGKIKKRNDSVRRDFLKIAKSKTKGAIIITSHCDTHSKRMEYINELKNHTDVTVLGTCGKKWNCGRRTIHDNCFDILNNTYAFYLAFENALCDNYHTEKLFENFKYDILFVTRSGRIDRSSSMFQSISANYFYDVKHLGRYLTKLTSSKEEYAKLLEEKSQYYAVDYADLYQEALCDLCYRLNHQDVFNKVIPDIMELFTSERSCTRPE